MNFSTQMLLVTGAGGIIFGTSVVAFILGGNPPHPRPELGARGLKRARALAKPGLFAICEPLIRLVAGWFRDVRAPRVRATVETQIKHAGDFLGMAADELFAMCLLTSLALGGITLWLSSFANLPIIFTLFGFALGAMLPWSRLKTEAADRARSVNRALPGAVDLAALCMGAGLDFPGSLRQIVDTAPDETAPIVEELDRLLQELELGYTRRRALEGLSDRVPTEQMSEFTNTVIQAEQKGNPLAEVLLIQAQMQRMRRSIRGEELASKAALMLMGPMMMIFVCVITLLIGPVALRFTGGLL